MKRNHYICAARNKESTHTHTVSAHLVREPIQELIRRDHPDWSEDSYICTEDLAAYRSNYVHTILELEKGDLSDLDREMLEIQIEHFPNWTRSSNGPTIAWSKSNQVGKVKRKETACLSYTLCCILRY